MHKKILFLLVFVLFFGIVNIALADCQGKGDSSSLTDPLCIDSPQALIGRVIAAALGIVGSLALLMFIFGGFTWMTSAGSAEKVTKGKNIMVWAAIGLVIIFSSYAIVKFVIRGVTTSGQTGSGVSPNTNSATTN